LPDFFAEDIDNSFNQSETNNTVGIDLDTVGNVDNSTNDSDNVDVALDNVGNVDETNTETNTTVGVTDSFNEFLEETDNSINNSGNDLSDNSINDSGNDSSMNNSGNSYSFDITDDHSINAGNREYNTGFGDLHLGGGAGGGGGDLWINNSATIVDQSVNGNIAAEGDVAYGSASTANVASGEGSWAAGGDITVDQFRDDSTNISADGDVNIGNTTTISNELFSNNSYTDSSEYTDASQDWDITDSFNDDSTNVAVDNSFNDELTETNTSTWDIDADVIWGSDDSVIADDVSVDVDFDAL